MKKKFVLGSIALIIYLVFVGSGCSAAKKEFRRADDKIFTRYGNFELVRKNNDLYLQKPDGSNAIRMTFTPKLKESHAFIRSISGYLIYSVEENPAKPPKYYIQSMDIGIKSRKRITEKEFNHYLLER